jgi:transcriptional regulator with XRE-family HTH domain
MDGLDKRMLGRNIRAARRQLGLTQAQMAERLEMTTDEYGRVERGNMAPRLERFVAICRMLGETPESLMAKQGAGAAESRNPTQAPEESLRVLRTTLAVNVRRARQLMGLTQAQMAEQINMPVATYGRLERGNLLPSLESFVAICRVLGDLAGTLLEPPRSRKR